VNQSKSDALSAGYDEAEMIRGRQDDGKLALTRALGGAWHTARSVGRSRCTSSH